MTARVRPMWLGSPNGPVFAVLHLPPGEELRGGVLLCPAFHSEYISAHKAYRVLADSLTAAGFAVVRFDYSGTGDSADPPHAGPPEWLASISAGEQLLRDVGASWVAVVGLRLGATVLSRWLDSLSADAAVLWDPVVSGRRLLREHSLRYRMTTGRTERRDDGAVDTLSFFIDAESARHIEELALTLPDTRAMPLLLIERAGRDKAGSHDDSDNVTRVAVVGQDQLLDTDVFQRVLPYGTLTLIAEWLDAQAPRDRAGFSVPETARSATFAAGDTRVTESILELGDSHAFAIETVPSDGQPAGPTIVLLNTATDHHIGPGRMWVGLGRRWAAAGFRVVRMDFPGIGESPPAPDRPAEQSYDPDYLGDIPDLAQSIGHGAPTVPIGLCSGAYHALEWSMLASTDAAVALNPVLSFVPPEAHSGPLDPRRRVVQVPTRAARWLGASERLSGIKHRLPKPMWRLFSTLRWHKAPTEGLRMVVDQGVDTLVFLSGADAEPYLRGGTPDIRAMSSGGRFRLVTAGEDDHALLTTPARDQVWQLLDDWVRHHRHGPDGGSAS